MHLPQDQGGGKVSRKKRINMNCQFKSETSLHQIHKFYKIAKKLFIPAYSSSFLVIPSHYPVHHIYFFFFLNYKYIEKTLGMNTFRTLILLMKTEMLNNKEQYSTDF